MEKIIMIFMLSVSLLFVPNVWADCSSEVYDNDSGEYLYNTDAQSRCEEAVEEAIEEACSDGFRRCRNECDRDDCEDACRAGKRACENSI